MYVKSHFIGAAAQRTKHNLKIRIAKKRYKKTVGMFTTDQRRLRNAYMVVMKNLLLEFICKNKTILVFETLKIFKIKYFL